MTDHSPSWTPILLIVGTVLAPMVVAVSVPCDMGWPAFCGLVYGVVAASECAYLAWLFLGRSSSAQAAWRQSDWHTHT